MLEGLKPSNNQGNSNSIFPTAKKYFLTYTQTQKTAYTKTRH